MLGLTLREEFRGKRLKGTAIELSNDTNTGATQIAARQFLDITYPTHDLLKAIAAVGPNQGRPVAVIGERGLGKSHLMAALYHTVNDSASTSAWLNYWANTLGDPQMEQIALRSGMFVLGESLHKHRYKFLWDLLLERHPHGNFIKGKWEGMGAAKTDIPSDKLMLELFQHTPTMLLLDEFQTWYDGLTNTKQYPWKHWAYNFIQILSEIAKEHPELLVLVISVRNGGSDAYQQVHRVNPITIDFQAGGNAQRIQQDRRRMLLHRLFDNRLQIPGSNIESLMATHISEYFRLMNVLPSEQDRRRKDFAESWPFAPHLLRLLEEQVAMKILHGDVWKRRGISLLWGSQTLSALTDAQSVVSIRQFFAMQGNWPSELPSNVGKTVVVAGLEGCIDILKPSEAESWLESDLRPAIFDFQAEYDLEAALVFWLPTGKGRVRMNPATEDYYWMCSAPHSNQKLDLGRILWAGAAADVGRIMEPNHANTDPDGPAWIGLHLTRLS